MYTYTLLDPRQPNRASLLRQLAEISMLGVEVTIPELADACQLGNIDPQHAGQDISTSAIEAAVDWPLPPAGTMLATIRPDADAFGAMAVLTLRARGVKIVGHIAGRVKEIGIDDRSASEWAPGQSIAHVTTLQCLKAVCFGSARSVSDRVEIMIQYLLSGHMPSALHLTTAARIREERREHAAVAADVRVVAGGRIAVVESTSRYAVTAAYRHADVVVAVNPKFSFAGGPPHRKVTICQARPGLIDLPAVFADLNALEEGWAGSPVVGGSPQGEDCTVGLDRIVATVTNRLL